MHLVCPSSGAKDKEAKGDKKKRRRNEDDEEERLHTAGAGTPTYTAPEVVNGEAAYGTKSDVWSMGVVMYEMFTGEALPASAISLDTCLDAQLFSHAECMYTCHWRR